MNDSIDCFICSVCSKLSMVESALVCPECRKIFCSDHDECPKCGGELQTVDKYEENVL